MELFHLNQVSKTYAGADAAAIRECSLRIDKGAYLSVQGVSGSGKSTLLLMMSGLLPPTGGEILHRGQNIYAMNDRELSAWRGKTVGYLFQNVQLAQALTVRENILLSRRFGNRPHNNVDALLSDLGLADAADRLPGRLSGGQRRRAMIGCVLIREPEVLLADEPTNDLDPRWAEKIMDDLEQTTTKGTALVLVTHDQRWSSTAPIRYAMDGGVLTRLA